MTSSKRIFFDHEKLNVYQESVAFVAWLTPILEGLARVGDVKDQLDRASTSIPFNIAEGNGRFSLKDRCRFFDIANGSALECAAGLDVLGAKGKLTFDQIDPGKEKLARIVKMIIGLLKRSAERDYQPRSPQSEHRAGNEEKA